MKVPSSIIWFLFVFLTNIFERNGNIINKTAFSGMLTAPMLTMRASAAIRCQHWGGGAEVNRFEEVSSLAHQMSLAGQGRRGPKIPVQ